MDKPLSDLTQSFLNELRVLAHKYSETHAIAYVVVPDGPNEMPRYEGNACMVCVRDGYDKLIQNMGLVHGHHIPVTSKEQVH